MILTERAYGMDKRQLQGLMSLDANISAADISNGKSTNTPLVQSGSNALIGVNGALFQKPNIFTMLGYGTSLVDIQNQLNVAQANPSIKKIILNFDSPGGSVTGINELANAIKAIKKPITAYVSGSAASAAFWLAAACDEIICDATAMVGSIGIVGIFQKNNQDTIEIVSSNASNKRPDIETNEGKNILLQTIDDLEAVFISSLIQLRPNLSEENIKALRGGVLIGGNAVNKKFADGVGSLQGLIDGKPAEKPPIMPIESQDKASSGDWAAAFAQASPPIFSAASSENDNKQENADNSGWRLAFSKASS